MKKLIPVIVAALLLMLASPVFAADVKFNGSLYTTSGYEAGLFHDGTLGLGIEARLSENLKAVVGLKARSNDLLKSEWLSEGGMNWSNFALFIDRAYIESNGALIPGLPSMTTRLGTQIIGYSPLNAAIKAEGIGVSGLDLGPVTLAGFQAWKNTTQVRGAQIGVNAIDGLLVKANVIHSGEGSSQELSTSVEGTVKPFEAMTINAGFGYLHGTDPAMAVLGKMDVQALPFLNVHAGARKVDTGYVPAYRGLYSTGDPIVAEDAIGFNGGFTAQALGATLVTNLDRAVTISTDAVTYTGEMLLERPLSVAGMTFVPKYELTLEKVDAGEIGIANQVVSVGYKAPNNLSITGGVNLTDISKPVPFVGAEMSVSF